MSEWDNILTAMRADKVPDAEQAQIAINYFNGAVAPAMKLDGVPLSEQATVKTNFLSTLGTPPERPSRMPTLSAYGIGATEPIQDSIKSNIIPGMDVPSPAKPVLPPPIQSIQPEPMDQFINFANDKIRLQGMDNRSPGRQLAVETLNKKIPGLISGLRAAEVRGVPPISTTPFLDKAEEATKTVADIGLSFNPLIAGTSWVLTETARHAAKMLSEVQGATPEEASRVGDEVAALMAQTTSWNPQSKVGQAIAKKIGPAFSDFSKAIGEVTGPAVDLVGQLPGINPDINKPMFSGKIDTHLLRPVSQFIGENVAFLAVGKIIDAAKGEILNKTGATKKAAMDNLTQDVADFFYQNSDKPMSPLESQWVAKDIVTKNIEGNVSAADLRNARRAFAANAEVVKADLAAARDPNIINVTPSPVPPERIGLPAPEAGIAGTSTGSPSTPRPPLPTLRLSKNVPELPPWVPQPKNVPSAAPERPQALLAPEGEVIPVGKEPDISPSKESVVLDKGQFPVERIAVNNIKVNPDELQFKLDVNAEGVQKPLEGNWNELAAGNLLLWQNKEGDQFVANGHHRLAKAKEMGVDTVNAQVLKESDGYTINDARRIAAESNILEGKGTIYDHAEYFRLQPESFTPDVAKQRGIAGRGFIIGRDATPDTYTQFRMRAITPEHAEAISKGAPGEPSLQAAGVRYSLDHPRADAYEVENFIHALSTIKRPASSGDLFGFDDSAIKAAEKMGKAAASIIRDLRDNIAAVQGAAKRPERARALGVDVKDPEVIKAKIAELKGQVEEWGRWSTDTEKVSELKQRAGLEPGVSEEQAAYDAKNPASVQDLLNKGKEQSIPGLSPEETFTLTSPEAKKKIAQKPKEPENYTLFEKTAPYGEKPEPGFFSQLTKSVESLKFTRMPAEQLRSTLQGPKHGVTKAEFDNVLGELKGPVTKQQVMDAIKENTTEFKDVMLGGAEDRQKIDNARNEIQHLVAKYDTEFANEIDDKFDAEDIRAYDEAITSFQNEYYDDNPNRDRDIIRQDAQGNAIYGGFTGKLSEEDTVKLEQLQKIVYEGSSRGYGGGTGPKFDSVTSKGVEGGLPGTYRELTVTMAVRKSVPSYEEWKSLEKMPHPEYEDIFGELPKPDTSRERYEKEKRLMPNPGETYWFDQHSQYENISRPVIRIHFDDREVNGKHILFIREMQSIAKTKPASMPQWAWDRAYDIGVKRILAYAKENGYDGVSWSTGQIVADRYDLRKQIREIDYVKTATKGENGASSDFYHIQVYGLNGENVHGGEYPTSALPDIVGKEITDRILSGEGRKASGSNEKVLEGLDLEIGGEGIKDTYDRRLPGLFKKYGKESVGEIKGITAPGKYVATFDPVYGDYIVANPEGTGTRFKTVEEANAYIKEQNIKGEPTIPFIPITDKTPGSYAMYEKKVPYESALDKNGNYDILEAKRKGYVTNQLELDLDGYGRDIETVRKSALPTPGRGLGTQSGGLRTIASKIPADLKNRGFVSLVGTKVETSRDLAAAAQIFRDPRVETLRIFYLKSQVIVGHEGISSRMPGFVSFAASTYGQKVPGGYDVITPKQKTQFFSDRQEAKNLMEKRNDAELTRQIVGIISRAGRMGADEINLLHNHPSENVTASDQDIGYTAMMERKVGELAEKMNIANPPKIGRHVVIDHKQYLAFGPGEPPQKFDLPEGAANAPAGVPHELLGYEVKSQSALADIGRELQRPQGYGTLIYRSSNGHVTGIQDVSLGTLKGKGAPGFLKGRARDFGARDVFLYVDDLNSFGAQTANSLIFNGSLADVAHKRGNVLGGFAVDKNILFGEPAGKYKGTRVAEDAADYQGEPPAEEQRRGYVERQRNIIELPEIVEIAKELMGGKFPLARQKLGAALGRFYPGSGKIAVINNMTLPELARTLAHEIGHLNDWLQNKSMSKGNILGRIASLPHYVKSLLEEYPDSPNKILTDEDRKRLRGEAREKVALDASIPDRIIVEEITREVPKYEVTGVTPDMILDIMRGITNDPDNIYRFMQMATPVLKKSIVKHALRGMVDAQVAALGGRRQVGTETIVERVETVVPGHKKATVEETFRQMVKDEILKRNLYEKEVISRELKALTHEWKPFDEVPGEGHTKYRLSSKELYADAVSVLMNDPELLTRVAPVFQKAFFNYLERKPDFKSSYDAIQERLLDPETVLAKRREFVRGMAEKGAEIRVKRAEENRKRFTPSALGGEIRRLVINKDALAGEKVREWKKAGVNIPDHMRIDYWTEELPYINSEVSAFTRDVEKIVDEAKKKDISVIDLHEYMELNRAATERKGIYNPGGIGDNFATLQLDKMKRDVGAGKFADIEKFVSDFRIKFARHVLDVVAKADFLPRELTASMLNNPNYATFANLEYEINKKYGTGTGARIYQQYGMLGEVDNVFIQTALKGQALIRAARHHETKMAVLTALAQEGADGELIKAKRGPKGVGWAHPPDNTYGTIIVSPDGRPQAYHVDKEFADMWERQPDKANIIMTLGMAKKAILAKIYIAWTAGWLVANPFRDVQGTWQKVPEASGFLFKGFKGTLKDSFRAGFGMVPEREQRLLREHKIVPDRFWMEEFRWDQQERELLDHVMNPIRYSNDAMGRIIRARDYIKKHNLDKYMILPPIATFLNNLGQSLERWGKFGPEEALRLKQEATGIDIGKMRQAHLIRSRAGTPNSLAKGLMSRFLEIPFPFSNIAVQDIQSSFEAFRERPWTYGFKSIVNNILPTLIFSAMIAGYFDWISEDIKKTAKKAGRYIRRMYNVFPIATWKEDGVFLTIPKSYAGQVQGAITDSIITGDFTGSLGTLSQIIAAQPYNFDPFLASAWDWISYYGFEVVPTNYFYGSDIMSKQTAEAGGKDAFKALSRETWNNFFGGLLYRFRADTVTEANSEVKDLLGSPLSLGLNRFIRITDQGIRETNDRIIKEARKEAARSGQAIKAEKIEAINKLASKPTVTDAFGFWSQAVEDGKIDPIQTPFGAFRRSYMRMGSRKEGDVYIGSYLSAATTKERAALLNAWEKELSQKEYANIYGTLLRQGEISGEVIFEKGK